MKECRATQNNKNRELNKIKRVELRNKYFTKQEDGGLRKTRGCRTEQKTIGELNNAI